jgi:hypothetical protein
MVGFCISSVKSSGSNTGELVKSEDSDTKWKALKGDNSHTVIINNL